MHILSAKYLNVDQTMIHVISDRGEHSIPYDFNGDLMNILNNWLNESEDNVIGPFVEEIPIQKDEINQERERRISETFSFDGNDYQLRKEDRENINGAATLAVIAISNGATAGNTYWHGANTEFTWLDSDNTPIVMDAPTMMAFGQAAALHKQRLIYKARELKDRVIGGEVFNYTLDEEWQ